MPSVHDVFGGTTLKAADLQGKTVPVTIETWEVRDFDDGRKIVLSFTGKDKTLVCNKTNANTIAEQCGEDLDNWIGKTIRLFPTQTDFQGKQVACIRVALSPQAVAPPASPPPEVERNTAPPSIVNEDDVPF